MATRRHTLYPVPKENSRAYDGLRIGLFGGSFNPAHAGHRQVADVALQRLKLDAVWWLVTPQNPLKSADDVAALSRRVKSAQEMANHPRMVVTTIEQDLNTRFTHATLRKLQTWFPKTKFVWLMGADNWRQFSQWQHWQGIAKRVPLVIMARAPYAVRGLSGLAAQTLRHNRCSSRKPKTPSWRYIQMPYNPLSSTQLRQETNWLYEQEHDQENPC